MSEDSAQEKTEEATPRKLEKAREDGQIPRSKELTTSAVLIAGTVSLMMFGGALASQLMEIVEYNFSLRREELFDPALMFAHLGHSFYQALMALIPIFVAVLVAAIAGPIALGGWMFSAKSLQPKMERINPMKGLGRMFSMKSLMELAKAIGKILIIIAVAYFLLQSMKHNLLGLADEALEAAVLHALTLSSWAAIIISSATILIAMIDIPFQIYDHANKMKMSKQDVKDEMKDSEGKPEVKGKIRQLQMQMAQNRMMQMVPDADVVITNPTHYSVALKYDPNSMDTPILLAKGVDHIAIKIREIAKANNIEFVESPPLARSIYHTTELEQEIPSGLFLAVAQVLAYVFQLREYRKGQGDRPHYPRNPEIPQDMKY